MPEQIPSQDDREFTSSKGHWAGTITWHPETYDGHTGFVEIPLSPTPPQLTINLSYPNLTPKPKMVVQAKLRASFEPGTGFHPVPTAYLTDGAYSYLYKYQGIEPGTSWEIYGVNKELPEDWNKASAQITVTPQGFPGDDTSVYLDDFSIIGTGGAAKTDHLPLLGVH
jgi:hypothetical protein